MVGKILTLQAGERTSVVGKPVSNKILLSVPDDEYRAIRPGLEYLNLPSHFTLHEPLRRETFPRNPDDRDTASEESFSQGRSTTPSTSAFLFPS